MRLPAIMKFSEDLTDPGLADTARAQYFADHPEAPLLAFVVNELSGWLQDRTRLGTQAESDKYVMSAATNIVNCIAVAGSRDPD